MASHLARHVYGVRRKSRVRRGVSRRRYQQGGSRVPDRRRALFGGRLPVPGFVEVREDLVEVGWVVDGVRFGVFDERVRVVDRVHGLAVLPMDRWGPLSAGLGAALQAPMQPLHQQQPERQHADGHQAHDGLG